MLPVVLASPLLCGSIIEVSAICEGRPLPGPSVTRSITDALLGDHTLWERFFNLGLHTATTVSALLLVIEWDGFSSDAELTCSDLSRDGTSKRVLWAERNWGLWGVALSLAERIGLLDPPTAFHQKRETFDHYGTLAGPRFEFYAATRQALVTMSDLYSSEQPSLLQLPHEARQDINLPLSGLDGSKFEKRIYQIATFRQQDLKSLCTKAKHRHPRLQTDDGFCKSVGSELGNHPSYDACDTFDGMYPSISDNPRPRLTWFQILPTSGIRRMWFCFSSTRCAT